LTLTCYLLYYSLNFFINYMLISYKDLKVWQKSILLVRNIYGLSRQLPAFERYILCSQMLRSSISISSNIAEGYGRQGKAEYLRFLRIALGSSRELETQIIICKQEYQSLDYTETEVILEEIQKMLWVLIRNIEQ